MPSSSRGPPTPGRTNDRTARTPHRAKIRTLHFRRTGPDRVIDTPYHSQQGSRRDPFNRGGRMRKTPLAIASVFILVGALALTPPAAAAPPPDPGGRDGLEVYVGTVNPQQLEKL